MQSVFTLAANVLSDDEAGRRERQASKNQARVAALANLGLTPAQATLFKIVDYGLVVEPWDLCERATIDDYAIAGAVTVHQARDALSDCFVKGWLRIVDATCLQELQTEIRNAGLIGPIYG